MSARKATSQTTTMSRDKQGQPETRLSLVAPDIALFVDDPMVAGRAKNVRKTLASMPVLQKNQERSERSAA